MELVLRLISIHAPAWGATFIAHIGFITRCHFNPRARVGRDIFIIKKGLLVINFNPRARVGRDETTNRLEQLCWISIHAPAWGATVGLGRDRDYARISIHAPAWGATYSAPCARILSQISIHAPAWGATGQAAGRCQRLADFNPRARVGRDQGRLRGRSGGRDFNPRARVGRDCLRRDAISLVVLFQSTRPRGARRTSDAAVVINRAISIHAPAWGATTRMSMGSIST